MGVDKNLVFEFENSILPTISKDFAFLDWCKFTEGLFMGIFPANYKVYAKYDRIISK